MIRTLRLCTILCLFALTLHAKTEFGKHDNAEFRIDVPDNWNRGLVVYYHGYDPSNQGAHFDQSKPLDPRLAVLTKNGFAVIQSGYSRGGWALEQAIPETESLHKYFIDKYGRPSETYVAGASMGGMLTVMTIEQSPQDYVGGLDLCGAVEDAPTLLAEAFDSRVVFDFYFPGLLPDPSKVPNDYAISDDLVKKVTNAVKAKPQAALAMRQYLHLKSNQDLVGGILFGTWILKDIQRRAGGNPFDNRNTIYIGAPDDNTLNDKVKRYPGSRDALVYLQRFYTPTGHITRPVLEVHTTYDPLVSPKIPGRYAQLTRTVGTDDFYVVQYVKHDGHCNFTPEEIDRAFSELRHWKDTGARPNPGWLNVPAAPAPKKKAAATN